jgi:hypothetical protein
MGPTLFQAIAYRKEAVQWLLIVVVVPLSFTSPRAKPGQCFHRLPDKYTATRVLLANGTDAALHWRDE